MFQVVLWSVWPDLAKFRQLGRILKVFLQILYTLGQFFIALNGQILKNNLAICSHWLQYCKLAVPTWLFEHILTLTTFIKTIWQESNSCYLTTKLAQQSLLATATYRRFESSHGNFSFAVYFSWWNLNHGLVTFQLALVKLTAYIIYIALVSLWHSGYRVVLRGLRSHFEIRPIEIYLVGYLKAVDDLKRHLRQ